MDLKSEIEEVDVENESADIGSDDSSVIFVSDMSVSEVESVNLEDEETLLDEDDKDAVGNEMQVVTETTTTTEVITATEERILKVDKATQTYENEFPVQPNIGPGTLALCNTVVPSTASTSNNQISVLNVSAVNGLSTSVVPSDASTCNSQSNFLRYFDSSTSASRDAVLSEGSTPIIRSITPYVSPLNNTRKNTAIDSILSAINNNESTGKDGSASTSSKSNNSNAVDNNKNSDKNGSASTSSKSNNSNAVDNKGSASTSRKSVRFNDDNDKENRGKNDSASTSKDDDDSRSSVRRTWTRSRSYQNHRMQPYQRYNNYYSARQNDYDRYGGRPPSDYYNNNSYGYRGRYQSDYYNNNRYNNNSYGHCAPYNSYHPQRGWQVQNYTYQFKERLFNGFVRFMDYVFQYDYTRRN